MVRENIALLVLVHFPLSHFSRSVVLFTQTNYSLCNGKNSDNYKANVGQKK